MKRLLFILLIMNMFSGLVFSRTARQQSFPKNIQYKIQPYYRYRADGQAGREIKLKFIDTKLFGQSVLEINSGNIHETVPLETGIAGADSVTFLLPPEIGVKQNADVKLFLRNGTNKWNQKIKVPALRHWTVFVYPHSHVDIGYSNTQENVEFIHRRDIDQGIALAERTKNYPDGARYLWNTEVMWPLERYMQRASDVEKNKLIAAVKKGQLCLDAAYVHVNTSTCSDEELFQLFKSRRDWVKLTGKPIDVMVQVDVPGMSWGVVPVLAHEGIKYIMMMPNGTRGNQEKTYALNQKPFWWAGPDRKSKVLFFQPGSYAVGLAKGATTGRPWFGQQDTAKIPLVVKTDNPRRNFLDDHLFKTLPELELKKHPYDFYVVTWAMWDNALLDADLPEAVKSWNEDYAYPHLKIASAHEIMETIEKRYGNDLPIVRGDYTEYWTDNMGVAARQTKMNLSARERLAQAETVWCLLHPGRPAPRAEFDEAWRNVLLGSEHTYASENQYDPFFFNAIWKVKKSYFRKAKDQSIELMEKALAPATDRSEGALGPKEGPSNGGVAVINTHSWKQDGLVTLKKIESQQGNRVIDDQGNEVRAQRLSNGDLVFWASCVPAFGSRHYRVVPGECTLPVTCKFAGNVLDNGILQVEINRQTGNVTRLQEIASGRNYIENGQSINKFWWQPARGAGDARTDGNIVISLKETGPLLTEVQVKSDAPGCRSVVRTIRLIHGQSWCEFVNTVDKLPLTEKDGIHFEHSFNIPGSQTRVDIPWGVMRLEEDQWPAANRAWMATQHWVDISNSSEGVTWCSLDAPLFESGSITANNTAGWDGKGDVWPAKLAQSSKIYSWVMNNHWYTNTPPTQDGPVTFRYRVLPHERYNAASANRFALEQAQPLVPVLCDKNPMEKPLLSVDNNKVCVTMLKSLGDGKSMIVKIRSFSEKNEPVYFTWFDRHPESVFVCDIGEIGNRKISDNVIVPAMGLVTLCVQW